MYRRGSFSILRIISIGFIFLAVMLLIFQLIRFSRMRTNFPPGQIIGGVPVGGLTQQAAAERLMQAYGVPVELRYGGAVIQLRPSVVGFELKLESMMAAADLQRVNQAFWVAFWDYIWNQLNLPPDVPLISDYSDERLRAYLEDEIAIRYDQPASPPVPIPGSTNFEAGKPGTVLDVERAVVLIANALRSPTSRVVNLTFREISPTRPTLQNLQILIQQTIELAEFDGLTEVYLLDLETQQELNFAYQNGENVVPGIAFTAASTMKIPIMIATYKRTPEPIPQNIEELVALMIERSGNEIADTLMKSVMDVNLAPLQMTEELRAIGLEDTFMAGYFTIGSPLLQRILTPANTREDINTEPDEYNQTTPVEMGSLLEDIYQCSENGGGTFAAAFPGDITQSECRQMVDYLSKNLIGVLIQAGLPEGTRFAHKHGWSVDTLDGLIHQMSDAGIVYSPGGNYILAIYQYHPVQLVFDPVNMLVANISRTVYNFYNME